MISFSDFYKADEFVFSVEIFPPKTPEGIAKVFDELQQIRELKPAFVSVTYGAMGNTRELTEDLAIAIHKKMDIPTAFHFTCVGAGREEIKKYVQHLAAEGVQLVVALRGDLPKGQNAFDTPADGFCYANELVEYLKSVHPFSMAVAGYPEKHIEAESFADDLLNLKRKVEAGADIVLTQLFYNNDCYYDFVERARKIGITVPIIPGILPIVNLKQVEKITTLCGATLPKDLHQNLINNENDSDAIKKIGEEFALEQCLDLVKHGVPGIHFYSMNKTDTIKRIVTEIKN